MAARNKEERLRLDAFAEFIRFGQKVEKLSSGWATLVFESSPCCAIPRYNRINGGNMTSQVCGLCTADSSENPGYR